VKLAHKINQLSKPYIFNRKMKTTTYKNYWSHLLHLLAGLLPVVSNILISLLKYLEIAAKTIRLFYKNFTEYQAALQKNTTGWKSFRSGTESWSLSETLWN